MDRYPPPVGTANLSPSLDPHPAKPGAPATGRHADEHPGAGRAFGHFQRPSLPPLVTTGCAPARHARWWVEPIPVQLERR
ncbi:MAG: hypothetical protein K0B14_08210 [Anaerolineaceae bacterium]|nr:hypothetical protein [Anaerolineaceae bacterium]